MAISKAAVKSSLTPKPFKRQTMYRSCSFGSIQPTAPTKDSSDHWNSDSVFLFLIVLNCKSASLPPPFPFNSRLYLLVCLGFLLETTRPQGLQTSESFSERSHFLVTSFYFVLNYYSPHLTCSRSSISPKHDLVFSYFINSWRLKLAEFTVEGEYGIVSLSD